MTTYEISGQGLTLTTVHAASSYGVPVLLFRGQAYGPGDRLPAHHNGLYDVPEQSAADRVAVEFGEMARLIHPDEAFELAQRFCAAAGVTL